MKASRTVVCKKCAQCSGTYSADYPATVCPVDGCQLMEIFDDPWLGVTLANRYVILEQAGAGGWGTVYLAEQLALGRKVAVKILDSKLSRNQSIAKRFEQEAVTLSALQHPGIVSIIDFGMMPQPYIVMEWIPGPDLSESFKMGARFSFENQLDIFRQMADALQHAHGMHVTHRDLKPANIKVLFTPQKEPWTKILDFGLAKLRIGEDAGFTRTGECVGSPSYMSPEQCMGRQLSPSSDIYSLGCVMYEMLAGRPLFQKLTIEEYFAAHNSESPAPIFTAPSAAEKALEAIVLKCLSKLPEKRFKDASELISALRTLDSVPRSGPSSQNRSNGPGPKAVSAITGGVSLIAIAAGFFLFTQAHTNSQVSGPSGPVAEPQIVPVASAVGVRSAANSPASGVSDPVPDSVETKPDPARSSKPPAVHADATAAGARPAVSLKNATISSSSSSSSASSASSASTVPSKPSIEKVSRISPPQRKITQTNSTLPTPLAESQSQKSAVETAPVKPEKPAKTTEKNANAVASALPASSAGSAKPATEGLAAPDATDLEWVDEKRQRRVKLRLFRPAGIAAGSKRPMVLYSGYTLPDLDSWMIKSWVSNGFFVIAYDPSNLPPMKPSDNGFNALVVRDRMRDFHFVIDRVTDLIEDQDPLLGLAGTTFFLAGVRNSANSLMILTGVRPNTSEMWRKERVTNAHIKGFIFISPGYMSVRPSGMGQQIHLPLCVISVSDDVGSTRWDKDARTTELFSSAPVKLKYELQLNTTLEDLMTGNASKQKIRAASKLCNTFVRATFDSPSAIESLRKPMTSLVGPDDEYVYPEQEADQ